MLRPTQTRVHAPGGRSGGGRAMRSGGRAVRSAGASRIPTRREANRPCARRCCWKPCCWEKACCSDAYSDRQPGCGERACRQRVQGRRSVTVCCRSASRRRSTVACCAGKWIAVNSSRAQTLEAARYKADGSGPPYIKLPRAVRYRRSQLDAWMAEHDHPADRPTKSVAPKPAALPRRPKTVPLPPRAADIAPPGSRRKHAERGRLSVDP